MTTPTLTLPIFSKSKQFAKSCSHPNFFSLSALMLLLFVISKSCPTLCDPMDCNMPGFPVLHHLPEFAQLTSFESMRPFNHLILCHPLLFLPSINALHILVSPPRKTFFQCIPHLAKFYLFFKTQLNYIFLS